LLIFVLWAILMVVISMSQHLNKRRIELGAWEIFTNLPKSDRFGPRGWHFWTRQKMVPTHFSVPIYDGKWPLAGHNLVPKTRSPGTPNAGNNSIGGVFCSKTRRTSPFDRQGGTIWVLKK
jgi:hypothetical protein